MGRYWITDMPARRALTLEGGDVLTSKDIIKHLGYTLSLRKGARAPEGLAETRRSTQAEL